MVRPTRYLHPPDCLRSYAALAGDPSPPPGPDDLVYLMECGIRLTGLWI